MIDNEAAVFAAVSAELRKRFATIYITGAELTEAPSRFPAVSVVQEANEVNKQGATFQHLEHVATNGYRFDVYSNVSPQKAALDQTKEIAAVIDGVMENLRYFRIFSAPVANADVTITRRAARYQRNDLC